jgi:autoinducer 2-degrading protein
MYCLAITCRVIPGHEEEAAEHLRQLAVATRQEPGNVLYLAHRSPDDPQRFFLYEQFHTQADHAAHRATDSFQRHAVNGLFRLLESRDAAAYTLL